MEEFAISIIESGESILGRDSNNMCKDPEVGKDLKPVEPGFSTLVNMLSPFYTK